MMPRAQSGTWWRVATAQAESVHQKPAAAVWRLCFSAGHLNWNGRWFKQPFFTCDFLVLWHALWVTGSSSSGKITAWNSLPAPSGVQWRRDIGPSQNGLILASNSHADWYVEKLGHVVKEQTDSGMNNDQIKDKRNKYTFSYQQKTCLFIKLKGCLKHIISYTNACVCYHIVFMSNRQTKHNTTKLSI